MRKEDCFGGKCECYVLKHSMNCCSRDLPHTEGVFEFFNPDGGNTCLMDEDGKILDYIRDIKYCDKSSTSKDELLKRAFYFD